MIFFIKKIIYIACAVLVFGTASAACAQYLLEEKKEPSVEMAVRWNERCLTDIYTDLTIDTRKAFCACSAEHALQGLTAEELETLATGNGPPVDTKKLTNAAMAPCFRFPVAELEYKSCMEKDAFRHFFKSSNAQEAMCHCMADGITKYVESYGEDLVAYLLERYPRAKDDPFTRMQRSMEYMNELGKYRKSCMNMYAYQ